MVPSESQTYENVCAEADPETDKVRDPVVVAHILYHLNNKYKIRNGIRSKRNYIFSNDFSFFILFLCLLIFFRWGGGLCVIILSKQCDFFVVFIFFVYVVFFYIYITNNLPLKARSYLDTGNWLANLVRWVSNKDDIMQVKVVFLFEMLKIFPSIFMLRVLKDGKMKKTKA